MRPALWKSKPFAPSLVEGKFKLESLVNGVSAHANFSQPTSSGNPESHSPPVAGILQNFMRSLQPGESASQVGKGPQNNPAQSEHTYASKFTFAFVAST